MAHIATYLPKLISKRNSMPLYVTFFVTNRCNLKCEHCFYSSELNLPTQELTLEEVEKMTLTLEEFPVLNYSGGEPFLRDDLAEVTHAFYKNNKINYLTIPSNGTYEKRTLETMAKMCELCPKLTITLNFSVDGLEEEHNRIRSGGKGGGKLFVTTMKTFHAMKQLRKEKGFKNLKLGFITTFTATNQDHIEDLYEYLKDQGPDNISINLIRGIPKDPLVKNIDIAKYKSVVKKLQADMGDGTIPGFDPYLIAMASYRYDNIIKTYDENKYQSECYSSQIFCVLYPNGDVYPCELLDKSKMIGNIRDFDFDFRKLWFSEKNKEVADWIVGTKCFCTHECNASCNTSFNARHFLKIGVKAAGMQVKRLVK